MSVFKNEVGRPSNETLRKRRLIIIGSVLGCILLVFLLVSFASKTLTKKEVEKTEKQVYLREKTEEEKATEEYVKDFKATDEFYDKYFDDYEKMTEMNNLDNVLIVMSKDGIENNFGATFIVAAPNYTYFLQYENEEVRNNAYEEFNKLKEEGKVFSVNTNSKAIFFGNESANNYESGVKPMANSTYWYKTAMGTSTASSYISKNSSGNSVRLAILDSFPYSHPNYNMVYHNYFNTDRIINLDGGVQVSTSDHGIAVSSMSDSILPTSFTINQYDTFYASDFKTKVYKISRQSKVYVINMSFGFTKDNVNPSGYDATDYAAIKDAQDADVISVGGMSNDDNDARDWYPAAYSNVISVSGIDSNYNHIWNISDKNDFVAPAYDLHCVNINGPSTDGGTSLAAPLVASVVTMMKYYDKKISLSNIKKLLSYYAVTNKLNGFQRGKKGWGNGLVYVGNTKIFEDVKNKNYHDESPGTSRTTTTTTSTTSNPDVNPDNPTIWDTILEVLKKIFTFDNLKTVLQWTVNSCERFLDLSKESGFDEWVVNVLNSCTGQQVQEQKVDQTTTDKKPSTLITKGDYYLITNYTKTNKMKKQKDYICDGKSECYANAYYMKLIGKVPGVYYGSCTKGIVKASSCRNASKTSKIEYVCNLTCPNPKASKSNIGTAYNNLIKNNKPSILTIKNGNETRNVVIVGITKKAYATYKDSGNSNMSLDGFVVIDPWDGNLKVINENKISDVSNITGWEIVEVKN